MRAAIIAVVLAVLIASPRPNDRAGKPRGHNVPKVHATDGGAAADSGPPADCDAGAEGCTDYATITLTTLCGDATPEDPEVLSSAPCNVIGTAGHTFGIESVSINVDFGGETPCTGTSSWSCSLVCPGSGTYSVVISAFPFAPAEGLFSQLSYNVDCP